MLVEDEGRQATRGPTRAVQTEQRMPFGGFVLLKALGPRGGRRRGTREREEIFHNVEFKLNPLLGKGSQFPHGTQSSSESSFQGKF